MCAAAAEHTLARVLRSQISLSVRCAYNMQYNKHYDKVEVSSRRISVALNDGPYEIGRSLRMGRRPIDVKLRRTQCERAPRQKKDRKHRKFAVWRGNYFLISKPADLQASLISRTGCCLQKLSLCCAITGQIWGGRSSGFR